MFIMFISVVQGQSFQWLKKLKNSILQALYMGIPNYHSYNVGKHSLTSLLKFLLPCLTHFLHQLFTFTYLFMNILSLLKNNKIQSESHKPKVTEFINNSSALKKNIYRHSSRKNPKSCELSHDTNTIIKRRNKA